MGLRTACAIKIIPSRVFPTGNSGRACCLRGARRLSWLLFVGIYTQLFHAGTLGLSQEAIRSSLAGQDAMEAKKRAATAGQFNIKFANLALDLGTQLGIEYNDNIYYNSTSGQLSDVIFRPQLNTRAAWVLTDKNTLNLTLGVGYAKYVKYSNLDTPFMTPGSDMSFDVYAGDFVIDFHDRFSLLQDVSGQFISVTNVAYLNSFENTAGVLVNWDLNKAIVSTGYDHYNYISLTREFDYLTRQSELFFGRAVLAINPVTWAGLEVGGGLTSYETNELSGFSHVSAGALWEYRPSEYFSVRLAGGYAIYFADVPGAFNGASDISGFYSDLTVKHQVNPRISYTAAAGHEFQAGTSGNLRESYYFRGRAGWNMIRRSSLGTSFSYEHAIETYSNTTIPWNYYGVGIESFAFAEIDRQSDLVVLLKRFIPAGVWLHSESPCARPEISVLIHLQF
jgi:hypothetical protein